MIRQPRPSLRPFVGSLWASNDSRDRANAHAGAEREHAIPTGEMHLVIRLSPAPIRLFRDDDDLEGQSYGHAIVAGPRAAFHVKDVSSPVHAVGVQLHPAAATALFGATAEHLAGRHVPLDDLWGANAATLRDELATADDDAVRLDVLERVLAQRLPRVQGVHPAVALALARFRAGRDVGAVVEESGYSHRTLLEVFRRTMGLAPKQYSRVLRMRRVLRRIGNAPWADLAVDAGYSDQPHFVREFRAIAGVTPTEYVRAMPRHLNHVPVSPVPAPTRSDSFKTARRASR